MLCNLFSKFLSFPKTNYYKRSYFFSFREIASAIKKLLDAVNEVNAFIPGSIGKQSLEQRKREFVKYSKRFSNTLKEYFKEGQWVYFISSSWGSFIPMTS